MSPSGSVAKPGLLPAISGSLLQKQTDCWKAFCKVIRKDLAFIFLSWLWRYQVAWGGRGLETCFSNPAERVWSRSPGERVWCMSRSPGESRCPFYCSMSLSWFQIMQDCHNFYLLLPLLLHLSCGRKSLILWQHQKICAGCPSLPSPWVLWFRKAGGREEGRLGRDLVGKGFAAEAPADDNRDLIKAGLGSKCSQGRMATSLGLGFWDWHAPWP